MLAKLLGTEDGCELLRLKSGGMPGSRDGKVLGKSLGLEDGAAKGKVLGLTDDETVMYSEDGTMLE